MTEKEEYNAVRDSVLTKGIELLLGDIKKNASASDTIKVQPLTDPQTGVLLCSQSDMMLKRLGYVEALDWITGLIEHYQNNEYEGDSEQ